MTIDRDETSSAADAGAGADLLPDGPDDAGRTPGDEAGVVDPGGSATGGPAASAVKGGSATALEDFDAHGSPEPNSVETTPVVPGFSARLGRGGRPFGPVVAVVAGLLLVTAVIALGPLNLAGRGASPTPSASVSPIPTFGFAERSIGVASAPVTIEVWADFQCPFCGLFTHGIEPTLVREEAATGRALITYHDFAFLGQESSDAAIAARCAGAQGEFWRYHDLLFASQRGENQGAFSRDVLLGLAKFAKLDQTAFSSCLDDPAVAAAVRSDTATGRSLGITSTPTIRIVGPKGTDVILGITDPSTIEAAVERGGAPAPSPSASASGSAAPTSSGGAAGSGGAPAASGGTPAASAPGATTAKPSASAAP